MEGTANRTARSFRSEALSKVLAPFAAMWKVNAVTQLSNGNLEKTNLIWIFQVKQFLHDLKVSPTDLKPQSWTLLSQSLVALRGRVQHPSKNRARQAVSVGLAPPGLAPTVGSVLEGNCDRGLGDHRPFAEGLECYPCAVHLPVSGPTNDPTPNLTADALP